jgi:hypothetical protein
MNPYGYAGLYPFFKQSRATNQNAGIGCSPTMSLSVRAGLRRGKAVAPSVTHAAAALVERREDDNG